MDTDRSMSLELSKPLNFEGHSLGLPIFPSAFARMSQEERHYSFIHCTDAYQKLSQSISANFN